MLTNREVILGKIEVTYNTDPVPVAATNAVLVEEPDWGLVEDRMVERPAIRASIGQLKQLYGGSLFQVTFTVEIKGSGTAGTPPEFGAMLRGCGLGETIVASTSVAYSLVSAGHESVTTYFYQDGKLFKLTGGRGNATCDLTTGAVGKLMFTFIGHLSGPTDVALPAATYDTTVPVPLVSVPFAIGAYSAIINALTFDLGNEVSTPPDMSASDGYGETRITKRDVVGSFDPEAVLVATHDFIGIWKAGTTAALDTGVIGATAGNRFRVQMPAVYYRTPTRGDRNGIRTYQVPFGAAESTTDDELTITFT